MATITNAGLTVQQIEDLGRRIDIGVKEDDEITKYFELDEHPEGTQNFKFRALIPSPVSDEEVDDYVLHENIAPKGRALKYAEYVRQVTPYGTNFEYTREAVRLNADNVVADINKDAHGWAKSIKKHTAFRALKSSKSYITFNQKIANAFDKANAIFEAVEADPFENGNYVAFTTMGVKQSLTNELRAEGNTLFSDSEKKAANSAYVGTWQGVDIIVPKGAFKDLVSKETSDHYIIFCAHDSEDQNPLRACKRKGEWVEIFHNELGSGVIKDGDGNVVQDKNHQKGSIGVNISGFDFYVSDDRYVLICRIPKASVTVDISGEVKDPDSGTAFVTYDRVVKESLRGTVSDGGKNAITGPNAVKVKAQIQLANEKDVIWTSDKPNFATVDRNTGLVTGVAAGTATITAYDGETKVTHQVTVS